MITGVQPKVLLTQDEDGNLKLDENFKEMIYGDPKMNWKLIRERDGLINQSNAIMWVEWTEEGRFKERHEKPAIGRSLIMSPFNEFFTWQTTTITEIVEQTDSYIKFKTKNSNYELFKLEE
jgi:hypothetical protein